MPVASSPPERASLLCGAETFWNSLADSVSSSFPSPQSKLANFALPAKVHAKALDTPRKRQRESGTAVPHKISCASIQGMD